MRSLPTAVGQTNAVGFGRKLMLATGGQFAFSGANFVLSLAIMIYSTPELFGTFAFIQMLVFLNFGISGAILSSPLMAAINRENKPHDETVLSFFKVSFFCGLAGGALISLIIVTVMKQNFILALLFGIASLFLAMGRLGRTYLFDQDRARTVLRSDHVYSLALIIGAGAGIARGGIDLYWAAAMLIIGSLLAFMAMGKVVCRLQLKSLRQGTWSPFVEGFRTHGRHALVGVLSTEATGRAHAYIVTLWFGPAAFAPLAAVMLFFRPVELVSYSLGQFERARLARLLRDGAAAKAWQALRFIYASGAIAWLLNLTLILVITAYFHETVWADKYDLQIIWIAILLVALINAVLTMRTPPSTLLQANANFAPLARTTVISALITIPTVVLLSWFSGPVWSLGGPLCGAIVSTLLTNRLAGKLVRQNV